VSVRSFRRSGLLFLGAASLVACATVAAKVSTAADEEVIHFPHARHAENDVECKTCHKAIAKSTGLTEERQLPKEKVCLKCHSEWKDENKCATCHVAQPPRTYPSRARTVDFNHVFHLKQVDNACERCHKGLPEPGATQRFTPKMAICLECHQGDYNDGSCMPCHTDFRRVPLRPLAYFSHEGEFLKRHAHAARVEPNTCAQCHEQTFCADCHARTAATAVEFKLPERADRQFLHRNDYVTRHAMEAREDPALCSRCHGTSFCQDCHTRSRVTPLSKTPGSKHHPDGWYTPGSATFHGPEARRDIASCQVCHDRGAQTNCIGCHRIGGVGGNPHPPAFSSKHSAGEVKTNAMCRYCHG
jgi:hypothetical protein